MSFRIVVFALALVLIVMPLAQSAHAQTNAQPVTQGDGRVGFVRFVNNLFTNTSNVITTGVRGTAHAIGNIFSIITGGTVGGGVQSGTPAGGTTGGTGTGGGIGGSSAGTSGGSSSGSTGTVTDDKTPKKKSSK